MTARDDMSPVRVEDLPPWPCCGAHGHHAPDCHIVARVDKYRIQVGPVTVTATPDQERRIVAMTYEQRVRFARIMGGDAGG